jgi:hypothetical protein
MNMVNYVVLDLLVKSLINEVSLRPDDVLARLRLELFQSAGLVKFVNDNGGFVLLVKDKDDVSGGFDLGGAL